MISTSTEIWYLYNEIGELSKTKRFPKTQKRFHARLYPYVLDIGKDLVVETQEIAIVGAYNFGWINAAALRFYGYESSELIDRPKREPSLYDRYYAEISAWNWKSIKHEASPSKDCGSWDSEFVEGSVYIGSVFSLAPSGKYYTPFACTNVNKREAYRDEQFFAALDSVAESHGLYIESGEGDPCDLFACMSVDVDLSFDK